MIFVLLLPRYHITQKISIAAAYGDVVPVRAASGIGHRAEVHAVQKCVVLYISERRRKRNGFDTAVGECFTSDIGNSLRDGN